MGQLAKQAPRGFEWGRFAPHYFNQSRCKIPETQANFEEKASE